MIIWQPGMTLEAVETEVIQRAFAYYKKVKTTTAQALGISVRTLDTKLEAYAKEEEAQKMRIEEDARRRRDIREAHRFGTNARTSEQLDELERASNADEERRQAYAKERAEGRRPHVEVAGRSAASAVDSEGNTPPDGTRLEPAAGAPAQPGVPVPQREKVQSVLPPQAAVGGARGRR